MSKAKVKETEVQAAAVTETEAAEQPVLVYVGPTVRGVAERNTVFNNGISESLEAAGEREAAFKNLIIPVEKLSAAQKDIDNKSGALWVFYQKAEQYRA